MKDKTIKRRQSYTNEVVLLRSMLDGRFDTSEFIFNTAAITLVYLIVFGVNMLTSTTRGHSPIVSQLTSLNTITFGLALGITAGFITSVHLDII